MVFFKPCLLTLTCIVIAVWVTPASAAVNKQLACDACDAILTNCGFKNYVNANMNSEIENMDYTTKINEYVARGYHGVANFVTNTGIYSSLSEAACQNGFANTNIAGIIKRLATNLSKQYQSLYRGQDIKSTIGGKKPITFFCEKYMNDQNINFIRALFTTA